MGAMPLLSFFSTKPTINKININLVPEDPFFETVLGKTLRWSLSVGRYLVIFTELVVILSFVARFSLDRQLTNLNESIYQKRVLIESYADLENQVRLVQHKTDQYNQIEQQTNVVEVFPALTQIVPRGIEFSSLTIHQDSVIVAGQALSQHSLNLLINNFQLSTNFTRVSVDKIEANEAQQVGFEFLINAQTQEETVLAQ